MSPDSTCVCCDATVDEIAIACPSCEAEVFDDGLKEFAMVAGDEVMARGSVLPSGRVVAEGADSSALYTFEGLEETMDGFDDAQIVFESTFTVETTLSGNDVHVMSD